MVGVSTHFDNGAVEFIADAAKISVQFCFYGWMYQWFTVFGAEHEVYIIFYE
jgi:hypothetical protein